MSQKWRFDNLLEPEVGNFFDRQLEQIREEVLLEDQPPNNGFEFIPQGTDISPWAESYTHRMYEPLGVAEFISDYAEDLKFVDTATKEETFQVAEFGCAYKWSKLEIEKAEALNMDLSQKRAFAARQAVEQKFNRIMWYGSPSRGLWGVLNYPYIPRRLMPNPIGADTDGETILRDLNELANSVFDLTEQSAEPDTMLLPPAQYTYLASVPWSQGNDTTLLQHIQTNNPFLENIASARELQNAGPDGEDLVLVYRQANRVFEHKLVREFTQLPPQNEGLAVVTNCHAKSGGIASDYPLEAVIGELPQ